MFAEIQSLPRTRVAYVRYAGLYTHSGAAWAKLVSFFEHHCSGTVCEEPRYCALGHDNPLQTSVDKRHYDLCVAIPDDFSMPFLMHSKYIGGGEYFVITTEADIDSDIMTFTKIFRRVIEDLAPKANRVLDHNTPCIARYAVFNNHLPPEHFCTDFFLPLKSISE